MASSWWPLVRGAANIFLYNKLKKEKGEKREEGGGGRTTATIDGDGVGCVEERKRKKRKGKDFYKSRGEWKHAKLQELQSLHYLTYPRGT